MPNRHRDQFEDEGERQARALGIFLRRKFKKASFGEIVTGCTNIVLISIGIVAAAVYLGQLHEMKRTNDLTQSVANTAAKQLELIDRPWVSVSFTPESPLSFSGDQVQLSLRVAFNNVGHAVATNVVISGDQFLTSDPFHTVLSRQKKLCEKAAADTVGMNNGRLEMTLFPGREDISLRVGINLYMRDIMANLMDTHLNPTFHDKVFGPIYFVGCVDYQYAASPLHHQTRFAYEIGRAYPKGPTDELRAIKVGEDVPLDEIGMTRWIFGGDEAY